MKQVFNNQNIQVCNRVKDWKEALEIASKPLLEDGSITEQYVQNMIASVKENGPYMVLTDYFALMHARPGIGVNKMGMSLLIVKQPTSLEGKPVKIFLVMAALDNKSHLSSLQEVMNIFMKKNNYQIILSGDKEKIINLFKEGERV